MKQLMTITVCTAVFALSALAANPSATNAIQDIVEHARLVERDAQQMKLHLKTKALDKSLLEQKTASLEENVGKLKERVADFESSGPSLSDAQKQRWELVKTKVELLNLFTGQKKELLARGDLDKNRSWLRAYADGIARRAAMLQQSAGILAN